LFSKNLSKNLRIKANKVYGKEYVDYHLQTKHLVEKEAGKREFDISNKSDEKRW
jgi:hypothetical protein